MVFVEEELCGFEIDSRVGNGIYRKNVGCLVGYCLISFHFISSTQLWLHPITGLDKLATQFKFIANIQSILNVVNSHLLFVNPQICFCVQFYCNL